MNVVVVGLGNSVLTDDTIGLKISQRVKNELKNMEIPFGIEVKVLENEAGGWSIIDTVEGADTLILIDAILDKSLKPGGIKWYSPGKIFSSVRLNGHHNMDIFSAMELARKYHLKIPESVYILGVGTKDVSTFSEECTREAEPGIERGTQAVISKLRQIFSST
jgi:hydrogenase maturation protease